MTTQAVVRDQMQDAGAEGEYVVSDTVTQRWHERVKYEIGVIARGDWTRLAGLRRVEGPLCAER